MSILIVTGIDGARNCAAVVSKQLGMEVEAAEGCKSALAALRKREFAAVIVDETLAECDPAARRRDDRAGIPSARDQRASTGARGVICGDSTVAVLHTRNVPTQVRFLVDAFAAQIVTPR